MTASIIIYLLVCFALLVVLGEYTSRKLEGKNKWVKIISKLIVIFSVLAVFFILRGFG